MKPSGCRCGTAGSRFPSAEHRIEFESLALCQSPSVPLWKRGKTVAPNSIIACLPVLVHPVTMSMVCKPFVKERSSPSQGSQKDLAFCFAVASSVLHMLFPPLFPIFPALSCSQSIEKDGPRWDVYPRRICQGARLGGCAFLFWRLEVFKHLHILIRMASATRRIRLIQMHRCLGSRIISRRRFRR